MSTANKGSLFALLALLAAMPLFAQPHISQRGMSRRPAGATEVLILDLANDGIDLSGSVTTPLMGTGERTVRWTPVNSDDGFVLADAALLLDLQLITASPLAGETPSGWTLLRAASRLAAHGSMGRTTGSWTKGPKSRSAEEPAVPSSGWKALMALDGNGDGVVTASDPHWSDLRIFVDANADGVVQDGELSTLDEAGITELSTGGDGFVRSDGRRGGAERASLLQP